MCTTSFPSRSAGAGISLACRTRENERHFYMAGFSSRSARAENGCCHVVLDLYGEKHHLVPASFPSTSARTGQKKSRFVAAGFPSRSARAGNVSGFPSRSARARNLSCHVYRKKYTLLLPVFRPKAPAPKIILPYLPGKKWRGRTCIVYESLQNAGQANLQT